MHPSSVPGFGLLVIAAVVAVPLPASFNVVGTDSNFNHNLDNPSRSDFLTLIEPMPSATTVWDFSLGLGGDSAVTVSAVEDGLVPILVALQPLGISSSSIISKPISTFLSEPTTLMTTPEAASTLSPSTPLTRLPAHEQHLAVVRSRGGVIVATLLVILFLIIASFAIHELLFRRKYGPNSHCEINTPFDYGKGIYSFESKTVEPSSPPALGAHLHSSSSLYDSPVVLTSRFSDTTYEPSYDGHAYLGRERESSTHCKVEDVLSCFSRMLPTRPTPAVLLPQSQPITEWTTLPKAVRVPPPSAAFHQMRDSVTLARTRARQSLKAIVYNVEDVFDSLTRKLPTRPAPALLSSRLQHILESGAHSYHLPSPALTYFGQTRDSLSLVRTRRNIQPVVRSDKSSLLPTFSTVFGEEEWDVALAYGSLEKSGSLEPASALISWESRKTLRSL